MARYSNALGQTHVSVPRPVAEPAKPIELTYFAGMSYCGSTLLSLVLNTHPRILSIGEMGPRVIANRHNYLCSCGSETTECSFFLDVKRRMAEIGAEFDEINMNLRHGFSSHPLTQRALAGRLPIAGLERVRDALRDQLPPVRRRIDALARYNEAFIRCALQSTGKDIFLDATKSPVRVPFLQQLDANLKVVHLVRDPRGYTYSAMKHGAPDAAMAAHQWIRSHGSVERVLDRVPAENYVRVRYEDVCGDPERGLSKLTKFMGAGEFHLPDNYNDYPHHLIGNQMRDSETRRTRIRLDQKWKIALSEEDRKRVWAIAGKQAGRYGYSE